MFGWLTGDVLFRLGNDGVTWAELFGFVTGGASVWLTVRSRISNFPVGILNSAFFLIVFESVSFWADSALQIVFIGLGFLGWWQWLYGGQRHTRLVVGRASPATLLGCVAFVGLGTWGLTVLLVAGHDSAPLLDAFTTCLSLAAQWLLNTKKVQTWWFWIAADCVYIPLYWYKALDLTAVVYLLFLAMCFVGLRDWRRACTPVTDPLPVRA